MRIATLCILSLAACATPAAPEIPTKTPTVPAPQLATPTRPPAFPSKTPVKNTLTATPSYTPLPSHTPSPVHTLAAKVTFVATPADGDEVMEMPPAGGLATELAYLYHPEARDYIFAIDPKTWQVDQNGGWDFLRHASIPDCRVDLVPPSGPPLPERVYYRMVGPRTWVISEYAKIAIYEHRQLYLFLDGYPQEDCLRAQEGVLANILHIGEYKAGSTPKPVPSPTSRPGLSFNMCPQALPTLLQPGDRVYITADSLWLRSKPNLDDDTGIRTFRQYAPLVITLLDGVTCEEKYVFRQVEMYEMSEGGASYTGWMAESDGQEYFLALWDPGW